MHECCLRKTLELSHNARQDNRGFAGVLQTELHKVRNKKNQVEVGQQSVASQCLWLLKTPPLLNGLVCLPGGPVRGSDVINIWWSSMEVTFKASHCCTLPGDLFLLAELLPSVTNLSWCWLDKVCTVRITCFLYFHLNICRGCPEWAAIFYLL